MTYVTVYLPGDYDFDEADPDSLAALRAGLEALHQPDAEVRVVRHDWIPRPIIMLDGGAGEDEPG